MEVTAPPTSSEVVSSLERGLFDVRITHVRHADVPYALTHRAWYLNLPLDALRQLPWPWLGYNRFALASLRDQNYGRGKMPIRAWINEALAEAGLVASDYQINLVTLPRVAGFSFNPVSFWLCHDLDGQLRAVLVEVNSTFGERHCYLCRKPDGAIIDAHDELSARKLMYVSPFFPIDGEYCFRFHEMRDRLGIFIRLVREGQTVLFASMVGRLIPLTVGTLLARICRQPLPAWRVLFWIHVHAARLYLKGQRILPNTKPERPLVSRSKPSAKPAEEV